MPSLDLTEDEQKIIAEYSAGLLLKHDKNYSGAIHEIVEEEPDSEDSLNDDGMRVIEEETGNKKNPEEEVYEETEDNIEPDDPDYDEELSAKGNMGEGTGEISYSDMSIADVVGLDGFTVIYKDYEAHDIYPENNTDELVFSLQAEEGKELLVLNFSITNDLGDAKLCDVLNSESNFRVVIDGGEQIKANKTILLNDFSSYYDEIEGYGLRDAVIVFEVPAGTISTIQNLDLVIKKGNDLTYHKLR